MTGKEKVEVKTIKELRELIMNSEGISPDDIHFPNYRRASDIALDLITCGSLSLGQISGVVEIFCTAFDVMDEKIEEAFKRYSYND